MEADRPSPESAPVLTADVEPEGPGADAGGVPAVVAVVVTGGPAPHLERCIESLRDSDYPELTVLVVARGDSDLRSRVAAVLPHAFVRSVATTGFAGAANEVLTTVSGAPFLLFCHDDVVLDPTAIRVLVEEGYRSNAAIVGPKVVDVARPELLREVGWSVDRFGAPHSEIVPNELDQEQHDSVRDVFFVRDVCVLVRADLFAALEGFDGATDPGARTLDLCWRARLVGARVVVAPDARVRHHDDDGRDAGDRRLAQRHQVRALLTATGAPRILWIAPLAFLIQMAEAIAFLVRGRRGRAGALVSAWWWNLRHIPSVRVARRRAQSMRVVGDAEIHALQFRGSARVSAYLTGAWRTPDRMRALSDRSRDLADTTSARLRSMRGLIIVGLFALLLIGVRGLLVGRVAAVGSMSAWPGADDLLRAFTSEWRNAGLGAHAPAPPAFVVAALVRIVTFGADGFGRTVFVLAAFPVGIAGAYALGRRFAGPGWPALVAAVAYGINPVPRNAIERGHVGSLVVYALAPSVALAVLALGGVVTARWPRRRIAVLGAVGLAVTTAWFPLAILLPVVLVVGMAVAAPVTGPRSTAALARAGATVLGLALLVLVPWPLGFLGGGDRAGALGIVSAAAGSIGSLLRFTTADNGGGGVAWAFLVVALLVTLFATGEWSRAVVRWWGVVVLAWVLAALPLWTGGPSPEPEGVLVPAALGLAMIAAVGAGSFLGEIRRAGLGWRQAAAVGAGALLLVGALGFLGDVVGGRFHQPDGDWPAALSWMELQTDRGPFRVLWVGSPGAVPGALHRVGPDAYAMTVNGSGDLRDALPPPGGAGDRAAAREVRALTVGTSTRLGQAVAPMAVRYVVLPTRPGPGPARRTAATARLGARLAQQLDLRELQGTPGASIYENLAWVPADAVLAGDVPRGPARAPLGAVRGRIGPSAPAGTALWSQQYSDAWRAETGGGSVDHRRAAGWANAFTGPGRVTRVTFADQWWRWPAVLVELVIVAVLGGEALRRRRRHRRGRRRSRPAARTDSGVDA